MAKNYWIIDTDAGVDDCQALVLALTSNKIDILAITTVAGNVALPQVLKNTAETLKICQRPDIPYFIGCERPLISKLATSTAIHGKDGLNNYWDSKIEEGLPLPSQKSAVQAIIELSEIYANNINIVTIGPLTNLAMAVALSPDLPNRFNKVLVMGSAVHGKGNRSITAEFNIWCDPEAAYMVFERFPCIEIVPWETCIDQKHIFSAEFLKEYTSGTSEIGQFIAGITKVEEGRSSVFFCDPLTVAIAIDPSLVIKSHLKEGFVELSGKHTRGMTVIDWKDLDLVESGQEVRRRNLRIVESLDMAKIQELFLSSIR